MIFITLSGSYFTFYQATQHNIIQVPYNTSNLQQQHYGKSTKDTYAGLYSKSS